MIHWRIPYPCHEVPCPTCGNNFTKTRSTHNFCSRVCWRPPKFEPAQFWRRVKKSDGCWNWTGRHNGKGYGRYGDRYMHRYSWELHFGPIPDGLGVLHHCDNPSCVRPDHLFIGTTQDNADDMVSKGRGALGDKSGARKHPERMRRGERISWHKLKENDVRFIRRARANGAKYHELAARFGVHVMTIQQIFYGKSWKHVQ